MFWKTIFFTLSIISITKCLEIFNDLFFKSKFRVNLGPNHGLSPCKILSNEPIYSLQCSKGISTSISLEVPGLIPS